MKTIMKKTACLILAVLLLLPLASCSGNRETLPKSESIFDFSLAEHINETPINDVFKMLGVSKRSLTKNYLGEYLVEESVMFEGLAFDKWVSSDRKSSRTEFTGYDSTMYLSSIKYEHDFPAGTAPAEVLDAVEAVYTEMVNIYGGNGVGEGSDYTIQGMLVTEKIKGYSGAWWSAPGNSDYRISLYVRHNDEALRELYLRDNNVVLPEYEISVGYYLNYQSGAMWFHARSFLDDYGTTVLVLAILGIAVVLAVYWLIRRFILDSDRKKKTISATFARKVDIIGRVEQRTRERTLNGALYIALENRVLTFTNTETGEELKFSVGKKIKCDWPEQQTGKLTYSGKRFISFETEAA